MLTCAYDGREFIRVGYYVNNEYESDELNADPPAKPIIEKIRRNVLADKPRVTRFAIKWDSEASAPAEFPPEQPEADIQADEEEYGADELAEEDGDDAAAHAGTNGQSFASAGGDAEMGGVEEAAEPAEEDEMSEDGSVDLENESEDDLEEEEGEGDVADDGDDAMEVDDKPAGGSNQIMAH